MTFPTTTVRIDTENIFFAAFTFDTHPNSLLLPLMMVRTAIVAHNLDIYFDHFIVGCVVDDLLWREFLQALVR